MNSRDEGTIALSKTVISSVKSDHDDPVSTQWAHSKGKRALDVFIALSLLVLTFPFVLLTAFGIKLTSRGPVFFRQRRVGWSGSTFYMWKFRTMRTDCVHGPLVTKVGDSRLTPIGNTLRRFKVDELPQLVNVIRGEMSLVGPRPKVPHHERQVLIYRPGITGAASLAFRKEEELLHHLPEDALDDYQVEVLMPLKRRLDESYMRSSTLRSDLKLMVRTILGKGELIQQHDLLQFQHSLLSLNSALKATNSALSAGAQIFEESKAVTNAA